MGIKDIFYRPSHCNLESTLVKLNQETTWKTRHFGLIKTRRNFGVSCVKPKASWLDPNSVCPVHISHALISGWQLHWLCGEERIPARTSDLRIQFFCASSHAACPTGLRPAPAWNTESSPWSYLHRCCWPHSSRSCMPANYRPHAEPGSPWPSNYPKEKKKTQMMYPTQLNSFEWRNRGLCTKSSPVPTIHATWPLHK